MVPGIGRLTEAARVGLTMFGVRLYEQPTYTVERRLGNGVELRSYGPRPAVATDGNDPASFDRLARYIYGGNAGRDRIGMTLPVAEHGAPAFPDRASEQPSDMIFYLPRKLAGRGAPPPTDDRVRLVEVPAERVATVRLGGIPQPDRVAAREALLRDVLRSAGLRTAGPASLFLYDPPWTLPFLRRSEVAVPVA